MNQATTIELLFAQRKLHYRTQFQGLPISIENRKGSVRKGYSPEYGAWRTKMHYPYGYVRSTKHIGRDGQELDVFVGPNENAKNAYCIMIKKSPDFRKDDEEKVMLGFDSAEEAKKELLKHFDNPKFFGSMRTMSMHEFRKWVAPQKKIAAGGPGSGRHKEIDKRPSDKAMREARYDPRQTSLYGPGHEKELQEQKKLKKVKADGEWGHGIGQAHYDAVPSFHPPSLKKAKRVPTDDPMEKDNKFLDVTQRKSKAVKKMRTRLTKQHNTLGGIPPNTALNSHSGIFMPFVSN